jgi:ATP sulfurylase
MTLTDMWQPDKVREITACFGTTNPAHPGVARVLSQGDVYLGGPVWMIDQPRYEHYGSHRMTPRESRAKFDAYGWKSVVACRVDQPVGRGAEYLQKVALEIVDGLLLHTLVSATSPGDGSALRVRTAEALLEHYYPEHRALLSILATVPRYAGARERLWYAIVAKNYGCTHVIASAPDTGVYDAGDPLAIPSLVEAVPVSEVGITSLTFARAFFCKTCGTVATMRTCPHDASRHLSLEGAYAPDLLRDGELPRAEYFRPELARIMMAASQARPTPDAADSR